MTVSALSPLSRAAASSCARADARHAVVTKPSFGVANMRIIDSLYRHATMPLRGAKTE